MLRVRIPQPRLRAPDSGAGESYHPPPTSSHARRFPARGAAAPYQAVQSQGGDRLARALGPPPAVAVVPLASWRQAVASVPHLPAIGEHAPQRQLGDRVRRAPKDQSLDPQHAGCAARCATRSLAAHPRRTPLPRLRAPIVELPLDHDQAHAVRCTYP